MTEVNALGEFLRARRARVLPAQAGLPTSSGQRRTPGLRREEVAAIAGLSIDYYIRLERGRERNPSPAVIQSLADALQLDADERDHLWALSHYTAGRQPRNTPRRSQVSDSILALVERMRPCPALVLARNGDVVTANLEGLAIYTGIADWPTGKRNTIRWVFTHSLARDVLGDWHAAARTCVANLRSRIADDPEADDITSIIDELSKSSAEFATLWTRYDVHQRRSDTKLFLHPTLGKIALNHDSLQLDDPTLRLSLYQPASTADEDLLRMLALEADVTS